MKKLLPFVLILIICVSFFYKTFTKGLLPVPTDTLVGLYYPWYQRLPFKNFLITDPIRQQIPWRKLVIDDLKKGVLPLWNPYNFSGTSLSGNIQAGVFYPLNFLFFFLPFPVAWTLLIIAQPVLATVFLYLYLVHKKLSSGVAIFGSIVWAFCGFSISWLTWGTIVQTALWLPLMLLAIDRSLPILFIIASVCAFFAGHAQVALYSFIFAGLYGVLKRSWKMLPAAIIAIIISSVQWVPMEQLLTHSARLSDSSAWLKDGWFLPWQHLVQFVAPDYFGNPATLNYFSVWNYGEFIGYIGILPLIFAIYAVIFQKNTVIRFFSITTGVLFLFLLPTPLAKLPYQLHIPVWSSMQPTRLMVLVDFCLVALAALGLDAYVRKPDKKIWYVAAILMAVLLGLWGYAAYAKLDVSKHNLILPTMLFVASVIVLTTRKWKYIFLTLAIGMTVFDLFRFGWKFTPFTPREYFFPTTNAISFLQSQKKPFRIMSLDNRIMPPNVNAYYGIESIEGYDPIYDARYEEFIAALNRREPNITPPFGFNRIITVFTIDSPLLPLLNVKYVLSLEDLKRPDLELAYREGDTRIYFYKKGLPRMYPVANVLIAGSKQQVMDALYSKDFSPMKTAVIEEPIQGIVPGKGDVRIISYTGSEIYAQTSFDGSHFVVIANMFDSGWKAAIDGKETKIYRTNYIFQGVIVPGGDHIISLRYN